MSSEEDIRFNTAVQSYVDKFGQVPWGLDMPEPDVAEIEKAVLEGKEIQHLPYEKGILY